MLVSIEPALFIAAPILLLILPLKWLAASLIAATVHELAHIITVLLCRGQIHEIRIGIGGAVITATVPERHSDFFCTLAGPLGSCGLLLFWEYFPELSLCGAVQGFFNLLPIYPLDGAVLLHHILCFAAPQKADNILRTISYAIQILLCCAVIFVILSRHFQLLPLMILLLLSLMRKSPCKPE